MQLVIMRKAIGFLIVLFGVSQFLSAAFNQLDETAAQILSTINTAAVVSESTLLNL